MATFNQVTLIGNIVRDIELRQAGASVVATTAVAVNDRFKTASGEVREEACFLDIEVWGKQAELLQRYVKKGDPLFVQGKIKQESWVDKTTQEKKSKLKVKVDSFQFLSTNKDGSQEPRQSTPTPQHQAPRWTASEDDIPF